MGAGSGHICRSLEGVLLPTQTEMKRSPITRTRFKSGAGKKGKANKKANALLAKTYTGEKYCEARFPHECSGSSFLTWAHNAKRRKNPDLLHAALICQNAHNAIEFLPPEQMKRIVDGIIEGRKAA